MNNGGSTNPNLAVLAKLSFAVILSALPHLALAQPSTDFVRTHAVAIPELSDLPKQVRSEISDYKAILVGEMHGTNEAPEFFLGLAKSLVSQDRKLLLALEIPTAEQSLIDRFMREGDVQILKESPFFRGDYTFDGRSSRAMTALLLELRKLGIAVYCFDPANHGSNQERDSGMANNLLEQFVKQRAEVLLALAGNTHSRITKGVPWNAEFRPMGFELMALPNSAFNHEHTLAIKVRDFGGSAWVCMPDCRVHDLASVPSAYSSSTPHSYYFLKENESFEGYNATMFVRRLSASLPFVESSD